jgi:hypothetical protein
MIAYFGRDSPNDGWSLPMGQTRKRRAAASSALYQAIESFPEACQQCR